MGKRKGNHNKTKGRTNIRKQQNHIKINVKLSENYEKDHGKAHDQDDFCASAYGSPNTRRNSCRSLQ